MLSTAISRAGFWQSPIFRHLHAKEMFFDLPCMELLEEAMHEFTSKDASLTPPIHS